MTQRDSRVQYEPARQNWRWPFISVELHSSCSLFLPLFLFIHVCAQARKNNLSDCVCNDQRSSPLDATLQHASAFVVTPGWSLVFGASSSSYAKVQFIAPETVLLLINFVSSPSHIIHNKHSCVEPAEGTTAQTAASRTTTA
jgi:hypothetical protein